MHEIYVSHTYTTYAMCTAFKKVASDDLILLPLLTKAPLTLDTKQCTRIPCFRDSHAMFWKHDELNFFLHVVVPYEAAIKILQFCPYMCNTPKETFPV